MHWQQLFDWQTLLLGICQKHMVYSAVFNCLFCCFAPHNKLCCLPTPLCI